MEKPKEEHEWKRESRVKKIPSIMIRMQPMTNKITEILADHRRTARKGVRDRISKTPQEIFAP